jgi:hypothetical protein
MSHQILKLAAQPLRLVAILILGATVFLTSLQTGCATQPTDEDFSTPAADAGAPLASAGGASGGVLLDAPRSAEQLDQLIAPIALYPDELVAQVLAAATYPTEIVEADRWMQAHPDLRGDSLAKAVDLQPWDNSVKAVAQFPVVLTMMDKNLSWTSSLGEAYMNDSQAVMNAIQQMRGRAQQAGNLKSTPQQNVTSEGQTIVIEPAQPDIVYVPEYDPWLVYGAPIDFYPDWYGVPGLFIGGPGIGFGFGFGIGIFGGFGWGWHHWGADWHGHGIFYNHAPYLSHSPTFRAHHGPGGFGRPGGFANGPGVAGFHRGGFAHPGGDFRPGGISRGDTHGMHSGAFSGFNHGGVVGGFAARGRASAGGLHGGGFGGGFHGGGGHR